MPESVLPVAETPPTTHTRIFFGRLNHHRVVFSVPTVEFILKKPGTALSHRIFCTFGRQPANAWQPGLIGWEGEYVEHAVFSPAFIPVRLSAAPPIVAANTQTDWQPAMLAPNPATRVWLCG